jgi:hypothetical protein
MLESESKKFVTTIGGKTANAYFEKKGSGYAVPTWGIKYRDILKNLDQYRNWLTQCVEEFGDDIGVRLFLKNYESPDGLRHTLEELPAGTTRQMDLSPSKVKAVIDISKATPEQLEELRQKAEKLGGRIRIISDDEAKDLGAT